MCNSGVERSHNAHQTFTVAGRGGRKARQKGGVAIGTSLSEHLPSYQRREASRAAAGWKSPKKQKCVAKSKSCLVLKHCLLMTRTVKLAKTVIVKTLIDTNHS